VGDHDDDSPKRQTPPSLADLYRGIDRLRRELEESERGRERLKRENERLKKELDAIARKAVWFLFRSIWSTPNPPSKAKLLDGVGFS